MKWLPWLVFALFGFFLIGNNFSAKLGMIDDHEIANFLGSDGKINITEIPKVIMTTDVGQWGTYLRYRPSYYTLRVIESALWRDNATLWYVSRYLMLVVSMWLGWKILTTYFPKIISYLFVFYAMTMPFWPDLLTRLGPSEMYAVPAILLFVYGIIRNKLWMVSVGYAICVGSKENFLILFPILVGWSGYKGYTKKLTRTELIATLMLVVYTIFITTGILIATSRAGTDIYGTQISYRYRITRFVWDIPKIIHTRHMIPALLVLASGILISLKKVKNNPIVSHIGIMLVILFMIASQYVFYVNQLPSNMRYDFPALLLFPALDLVAMSMIITYFVRHKYSQKVKLVIYLVMILIFSFYIFHRGYTLVQRQSMKNAKETRVFQIELEKAKNIIKTNPDATIMFVSERYIDFEPIASVERFLTATRITNEFRLYYNPLKITQDPMELDDRLKQVMNGELGSDHIFDRFSAYKLDDKPCYSITFGSATPLQQCPEIANF
ncbi:MAG: hypothetical protein WCG44_01245 [bacterium]